MQYQNKKVIGKFQKESPDTLTFNKFVALSPKIKCYTHYIGDQGLSFCSDHLKEEILEVSQKHTSIRIMRGADGGRKTPCIKIK